MKQLQLLIFLLTSLISTASQADISGSSPAINYLLAPNSAKIILYDEFDTDNGWVFNSTLVGSASSASGVVENGNMAISWNARNKATTDILGLPPESVLMEAILPITAEVDRFDHLNMTFSIIEAFHVVEPAFGPAGHYSIAYGGVKFTCCLMSPSFNQNYPVTINYRYDKKRDKLTIRHNGVVQYFSNQANLVENNYEGPSELKVLGGEGQPSNLPNSDSGFSKIGHIYLETVIE